MMKEVQQWQWSCSRIRRMRHVQYAYAFVGTRMNGQDANAILQYYNRRSWRMFNLWAWNVYIDWTDSEEILSCRTNNDMPSNTVRTFTLLLLLFTFFFVFYYFNKIEDGTFSGDTKHLTPSLASSFCTFSWSNFWETEEKEKTILIQLGYYVQFLLEPPRIEDRSQGSRWQEHNLVPPLWLLDNQHLQSHKQHLLTTQRHSS